MNKTIFLALMFKVLLFSSLLNAQQYKTISINGYNHDVIANGTSTVAGAITADVDAANYCFKSLDWKLTGTSAAQTSGLPLNGTINSLLTPVPYQLQDYSANNSIRLSAAKTTIPTAPAVPTITSQVLETVSAKRLFILATSGSGASILDCLVTFSDDTTQAFTNNAVGDWYNGTANIVISGFGRLNVTNNGVENSTTSPKLFQITLSLLPANQTKTIKSIQFTRAAGSGGVINIFGVSAELLGTCPSPDAVTFSGITTSEAVATITVPAIIPAQGYAYEVRSSGAAGSGAAGLVKTGVVAAGSTTTTITALPSSVTLQFYIRSVCSTSDQGPWSGPFPFTMACGVTGAFYENFDTTATGSTVNPSVPQCWGVIKDGVGYLYNMGSGSFTAPNSIYFYNSFQDQGNLMLVSPKTAQLGNGGYRVRFRARSTTTLAQTVKIVTLPNQNSVEGMQVLATLNITNVYKEYIVNLPAGTHDYFGIAHGLDGTYRTMYVDDVRYEPIPTCVVPLGLIATEVGYNSAHISWDAVASPNALGYTYEIRTSGAPGSGPTGLVVTADVAPTVLSADISGLTLGVTYYAYVRANCSATDKSDWSADATVFKTGLCTPTYTEPENAQKRTTRFKINEVNFTDNIPNVNNRDRTGLNIPNLIAGNTYAFEVDVVGNLGVGFAVDYNKDGFFTGPGELLAVPNYINNQYATYTVSVTIPSTLAAGDYILRIWNRKATSTPTQETNPCSVLFEGTWVDYKLKVVRLCEVPTNVTATKITPNSAELNWTSNGTKFDVEYGVTGFVPGEGTLLTNIEKPYLLDGLLADTEYDFYVRKICDVDYISNWTPVKKFRTRCTMPDPVLVNTPILCNTINVADIALVNQGTDITKRWYSSLTSTTQINEILVAGTYYVMTENAQGCVSKRVGFEFVVASSTTPQTAPKQYFCNSATIADLVATPAAGFDTKWFATATATQALPLTQAIVNGTIYYVAQTTTTGCESNRVAVTAYVTNKPAQITVAEMALCKPTTFANVQGLGTVNGAIVKWYSSATAVTPINANTLVANGVYYVTQTLNTCESDRKAISITNVLGLSAPTASNQGICGGATVADLVVTGAIPGAEYRWYASASATVPLAPTSVVNSGTYYVTQATATCESDRKSIAVYIYNVTAPVVSPFSFCGSAKVADLQLMAPSGVTYRWYNTLTGGAELAKTAALNTGTYYVARDEQGCVSQRAAVAVTILDVPTAPTGITTQSFVVDAIGQVKVSDLIMDQINVVWYITLEDAKTGNNPLSPQLALVNGQTYYGVILGANGCPSAPTAVKVDVTLGTDDFEKSELVYYPNPTSDVLNIRYKNNIEEVIVYNLLGQKVLQKRFNDSEVVLDMSALSSGSYMVELHSDKQVHLLKIVKK